MPMRYPGGGGGSGGDRMNYPWNKQSCPLGGGECKSCDEDDFVIPCKNCTGGQAGKLTSISSPLFCPQSVPSINCTPIFSWVIAPPP